MADFELDDFKKMAEKHLEETSDLTMVVLKGHLLLETALNSALEKQCANPALLEKANLRFIQMVYLARALLPASEVPENAAKEEKFWDAMVALNQLRNRFAHNLEPKALADLYPRLFLQPPEAAEPPCEADLVKNLTITVSGLVGWTIGIGEHLARQERRRQTSRVSMQ